MLNFRDVTDILPEFDSAKVLGQSAEQWTNKLNLLKDAHEINENMMLLAVGQKLKGPAKIWYEDEMAECNMDWEDFVEKFEEEFQSKITDAEIHDCLRQKYRKKDQSLIDYYRGMVAVSRGKVTHAGLIRYIIRGINETVLGSSLASNCVNTLEELKEKIEWYVLVKGETSSESYTHHLRKNPNRESYEQLATNSRVQNVNRYVNPEGNRSGRVQRNEEFQRRKTQCFNCFGEGHFANNCPQPARKLKCTRCQKFEHTVEQCRDKAINEDKRVYAVEKQQDIGIRKKQTAPEKMASNNGNLQVGISRRKDDKFGGISRLWQYG